MASVGQKRLRHDIVTDEQGRQRFHGAFTGGFSAGELILFNETKRIN